jgi:hypothetical protein
MRSIKSKNSQSENHPKTSIETSSPQLQQQAMRQKHNRKEKHTRRSTNQKQYTYLGCE